MTVLAPGRTVAVVVVSRSRTARASRRRRRRLGTQTQDLTAAQWDALRDAWGGCAYCGATAGVLQRDCVLPVSRGGRYTLANVVPACRSCNTSKCNDEVTGWLRRKRLDERAFLLRHRDILAALLAQTAAPILSENSTSRLENPHSLSYQPSTLT